MSRLDKMLLQTAGLFVLLAAASALTPVENEHAVKIKGLVPDGDINPTDFLKVKCSFDLTKTNFTSLTKLKLYMSETGAEDDYEAVASVTQTKLTYGQRKKYISVRGKYQITTDYRSKLKVVWATEDLGWCTYYRCVATGRDPKNNKLLGVYVDKYIGAAEGETCGGAD
ncbi:hypothetical protein PoB_004477600 [Plakobranchus ocellatus]|uniref:Uncharacterized protein n=1 Tax=Plakobranchus ocellatus TaxID=259542 RepID=A0AAV4BHD3_9GAST|nr:hypothetical protein PoB_004477600 [Plakobranchus ocellatus]